MKTSIITIGDEILRGETLDTNSDYLSKKLFEAGAELVTKLTVSDKANDIVDALNYCFEKSSLIITTGGLGPTTDDITKQTLADYFHTRLIFYPDVKKQIEELLKHRYKTLSEAHLSQAMLPEKCIILKNRLGTASGMFFQEKEKRLISLPGVPFEMKDIFENEVTPLLRSLIQKKILSLSIKTAGVAESVIAGQIQEIERSLPADFRLAYLPSIGEVKLRLTTTYSQQNQLLLNDLQQKISSVLGDMVYGYGDISLPEAIGQILIRKNLSLSIAESCTGGYVSHLITTVPGSSAYFKGSMVSYSNEIKINQLKVEKAVIEKHGAVSEQCAIQMATNIRKIFDTDIGLSITGIAGPGGGTPDKPLGLVFICVANQEKSFVQKLIFDRGRMQNIQFFAVSALNILRKLIL